MLKRNAQGNGSIRLRPDGRWEGRYSLPPDPLTGKQSQKSIYAKTQKEVRQKLTVVLNDINKNTFVAPTQTTISQWLNTWLENYLGNVKPNTISQYKSNIKNHILPYIGDIKLYTLKTETIQKLYNKLLKNGLSAKSIRNINGTLHKALDIAIKFDYINNNPANNVILPKAIKKQMNVLSGQSLIDFIKIIEKHKYKNLFTIALFTGMRQGELIGLTWDCISLEDKLIKINKQLIKNRSENGNEYSFATLKNDKPRIIKPADIVFNALKDELNNQNVKSTINPAYENNLNLVFTNDIGKHLSAVTVYNHFKNLMTKLNKPNIRFHDLRHSYATLSIQNGDDIKTVSENLGHATTTFTLDIYGHVTDEMRKSSAERMNNFIRDNL